MNRDTLILADSLAVDMDAALARSRIALSVGNTVKAEQLAAEAGALARQIAALMPDTREPVVTVTLPERRTEWVEVAGEITQSMERAA